MVEVRSRNRGVVIFSSLSEAAPQTAGQNPATILIFTLKTSDMSAISSLSMVDEKLFWEPTRL